MLIELNTRGIQQGGYMIDMMPNSSISMKETVHSSPNLTQLMELLCFQ
jgi:hypothetical protein